MAYLRSLRDFYFFNCQKQVLLYLINLGYKYKLLFIIIGILKKKLQGEHTYEHFKRLYFRVSQLL